MRRIRWAAAAADDLQGIHDYLTENHPALTRSTVRHLYGVDADAIHIFRVIHGAENWRDPQPDSERTN